MTRILIADDHELMREALKSHLAALGEVQVTEAGSYADVLSHRSSAPGTSDFGLIVLDLSMPGALDDTPLARLGEIKAAFPGSKLVVFSALTDAQTAAGALRAGANGYIVKTTRGRALLSALRMVLDGETYVSPSVVEESAQSQASTQAPAADRPLSKLSPQEAKCLALLAQGKRNKQIAKELDLQENTVKMHLRSAFRKIGATNRIEAVRIALSDQEFQTAP